MKYVKNILLTILPLMLVFSAGFSRADTQPGNGITVYYFHRTIRCSSCLLLEELTREAVAAGFETELGNGDIRLLSINLDDAGNEHFVDDYGLSVQSVVVSEVENRKEKRWKRLDRVWELLHEEPQLIEYIQKEIHLYIRH